MSETNHLFVAMTEDAEENTVEIFCGPSVEWLRKEGILDDFKIERIVQIPDDFFMQLLINNYYFKDDDDPRFFFSSPGGSGQGSAGWLAQTIEGVGHVSTFCKRDLFMNILFPAPKVN